MDEVIELDKQLLLTLNGSDSLFWDSIWWDVSQTSTWTLMFVCLFWLVLRRDDWRFTVGFLLGFALCILFADQLSSGLIKPLVHRFRPTHDPEIGTMIDTVRGYRGGRYGFVSSHAANTFSVVTFLCLVVRRRLLWLTAFSWAALVCYSRIYLGVHYPGDILCGALLGVMVGWGVNWLYRYFLKKKAPGQMATEGFSEFRLRCFIASFFLTYLIIVLKAFLQ